MSERRYIPPLDYIESRPRRREYVYAFIAVLLWIFSQVGTLDMQAAQATENVVRERWAPEDMRESRFSAKKLSDMVVACMNNDQWIFQDPHTDSDFAVFCHVVEIGKVGR